ncbi:DedA family protein [Desulforamulus aquiferis]|uniref:DedA family protein n=1 Tax=Desulforamulus aquiferis TaxID=1397668 RepID=A0AAW7ZAN0_9FIRM|nr:DedA family protein [Desulforamulus aquiferis]MDO7786709.1 DedA family protein [Desulforamulus aquiferis]
MWEGGKKLEFLEAFLHQVTVIISALGYWGVAIGMAIESANIPLPSEVILPFGGYLVYTGRLDFWGTVMAGTVGGTIGSIGSYYLGLRGGRPFIERYGPYVGITPRKLLVADRWFEKYGEATVFFTRLMPVIRTFISLPAGIARMNFKRFVIYTFLGSLPWSILLVYTGYALGQNWQAIKPWFHKMDILIGVALAAVLIYWLCKKLKYR